MLCLQVCPYLYDPKLPGHPWWRIMNIRHNQKKKTKIKQKIIFLFWPSSIIHNYCSSFQLSALQQHIPERHVLCLDITGGPAEEIKEQWDQKCLLMCNLPAQKKIFLSWQSHSLTIQRIIALSEQQFLLNNVPSSFKLWAPCCLRQTRKWDFLFLFY